MILLAFPLPLHTSHVDPQSEAARLTRWVHGERPHARLGRFWWLYRRPLRHVGPEYAGTTAAVKGPQEGQQ